MRSRHFEVLAFCAMLLAAAALFVALLPNTRAASAQQVDTLAALDAPQTDIPATFNYQGILRNPDGSLMNGSPTITVKIYDAASGGPELHAEPFANVPVRDGLFNVVLGDQVSLPADFGNVAPLYIGVTVDGADELIPRQRVHPVPWALLADKATTLLPDASVEGLTLNGRTTISGIANIDGDLTVRDQKPIKILRYTLVNNIPIITGISADDYQCTMGGWETKMDIDENNAHLWSRRLVSSGGSNPLWIVQFNTPIHASTPIAQASVDVVCFKREITEVTNVGAAATASDVAPADIPSDPTSSPEEVGQGQ